MIKKISRLLLITIFGFYTLMMTVPTFTFYMFTIKSFSAKNSYIASIELGDRSDLAFSALALFNVVEPGTVRFEGKRPIYLKELGEVDLIMFPNLLGRAYPFHNKCLIKVNPLIKSERIFISTVLHEYVHCLGYLHVDNPNDLMYPYGNDLSSETIIDWAKKIKKEIFYE